MPGDFEGEGAMLQPQIDERLEAPSASDRAFFEQCPGRQYRLRPAFSVEIEYATQLVAFPDVSDALLTNHCYWIVVRQVVPGTRMKLTFLTSRDLSTETSEQTARTYWQRVVAMNPGMGEKISRARKILTGD
jgi:hypothetical protein